MKNERENQLLECAQNGDATAMWKLASMYHFPNREFEKALYWYKKAVENGFNDAILSIAMIYEQMDIQKAFQKGPKANPISYDLSETTIEWYKKALDFYESNYLNNPEYACLAAELLSDEDAIEINFEKAFNYYHHAANVENQPDNPWVNIAQSVLAKMYELGLGCDKNLELSKYYREKSKIDDYRYQEIEFHK